MVLGDFNEVRDANESFGTIFHASAARAFNVFILESGLVDVPLGGQSFTRSNNLGTKMSKLDRYLVSEGLLDLFMRLPWFWISIFRITPLVYYSIMSLTMVHRHFDFIILGCILMVSIIL